LGTYFAVLASVLSVGLALGVSMPLVSLRLEGWGYGRFAIGVMAAMPALGVLVGASLASRLAGWVGVPAAMRLCLWAGRCRSACWRCCPATRCGWCCG
jgi:hypothetical protein